MMTIYPGRYNVSVIITGLCNGLSLAWCKSLPNSMLFSRQFTSINILYLYSIWNKSQILLTQKMNLNMSSATQLTHKTKIYFGLDSVKMELNCIMKRATWLWYHEGLLRKLPFFSFWEHTVWCCPWWDFLISVERGLLLGFYGANNSDPLKSFWWIQWQFINVCLPPDMLIPGVAPRDTDVLSCIVCG